ncbi:MAG: hypothetical protein R3E68_19070 [Burkholderiaceae bacterium]
MSTVERRLRARGQAIVESLLALAVLAALVLATLMIARLHEVDRAASRMAARMAFDCAIRPDQCAPASGSALATGPRPRQYLAEGPNSLSNPAFWRTRAGTPLINADAPVLIERAGLSFDAGLGVAARGAASGAGSALQVLSRLAGPDRFGLQLQGGLVAHQVRLPVMADAPAFPAGSLLSAMSLTLQARSAILTDDWNARAPHGAGADTVDTRVAQGQRLAAWIERGHEIAYAPTRAFMVLMHGLMLEGDPDDFHHHEIDVDLIPADREGP